MVSFADLPYGLQRRLVELAPAKTLVDFELTGHLPLKLSRRLRKPVEKVEFLYTTDTKLLTQNDVVRVCAMLNLRINYPEKHQDTLDLIRGSYTMLQLDGSYPWQLLLGLIRPNVQSVRTNDRMLLPEEEVDTFVKELYTMMTRQNISVYVSGTWMVQLLPRLKIMAREFMYQRRRDGLKVPYIQVNLKSGTISSILIER
uniref:FTH domain-containing protein n=1 Tax=Panagrellus redivivus TaxID=6233 RepID=A0A7E4VLW3_PANRE